MKNLKKAMEFSLCVVDAIYTPEAMREVLALLVFPGTLNKTVYRIYTTGFVIKRLVSAFYGRNAE